MVPTLQMANITAILTDIPLGHRRLDRPYGLMEFFIIVKYGRK